LAAGTTTVLVCEGRRTTPETETIVVRLAIESCRGCTCFTVPAAETRACAALFADATFVKNSCTDQTSLKALLVKTSPWLLDRDGDFPLSCKAETLHLRKSLFLLFLPIGTKNILPAVFFWTL
jgi:hypothetical protein